MRPQASDPKHQTQSIRVRRRRETLLPEWRGLQELPGEPGMSVRGEPGTSVPGLITVRSTHQGDLRPPLA